MLGEKLRVRALIIKGGKGTKVREVALNLKHDGISLRFIDGRLEGDFFSFSALEDLGFNAPVPCHQLPLALRFRGNVVLVLVAGDNPLIYDKGKFEAFVHGVFMKLINGKPVLVRIPEGDTPWRRAYLKIVAPGKLLVVEEDNNQILSFPSVVGARIESLRGENVWALRKYTSAGLSWVYLKIPEKEIRLFVLRYLQRFSETTLGYLLSLSEEFPQVKKEIEVPELDALEREVIMAVLSGVDPLKVPGVLGRSVREVEQIYDRLIKKGLLRVVGIRKIVEPTKLARELEKGGGGE